MKSSIVLPTGSISVTSSPLVAEAGAGRLVGAQDIDIRRVAVVAVGECRQVVYEHAHLARSQCLIAERELIPAVKATLSKLIVVVPKFSSSINS